MMILWHAQASSLSTQWTQWGRAHSVIQTDLSSEMYFIPSAHCFPTTPHFINWKWHLCTPEELLSVPPALQNTLLRKSRNQPKGKQYGGEFRYYEISGVSSTAPKERHEWYPANTASSKASGKRVNSMQLLWPVDLAFHSFEWTGIPQKYSFYLWWWAYICCL